MKLFRTYMMADGDGGGAGAGGADPDKKDDPAKKEGDDHQDPPKYTDKQLNDLIAKESAKREKKASDDLLAKMGFKTLDDVDAYLKSKQEGMTQAEKDKAKLAEIETAAQTAAKERDESRAEIAALKAGVPADKVAKVVKLAGGYDGDTIDEKITALLTDFPDFVKAPAQQSGPDSAGRPSGSKGANDVDRLMALAREQAGLSKK